MTNDQWRHREHSIQFEVPPDVSFESFKARINATYKKVDEDMRRDLYGDHEVDMQYKLKRTRFSIYRDRIRDAWQVLLGRAEIGDGW